MNSILVRDIVNHSGSSGPAEIIVDSGIVVEVREAESEKTKSCNGIVVPGFIDLHTHGAMGHDIMDANPAGLEQIAKFHLRNGTTSLLASTLTAGLAELETRLSILREFVVQNEKNAAQGSSSTVLGVHLEGPWISPERAGAQNPEHMRAPDQESEQLIRRFADIVRMVTMSYHYPGAPEFLDMLVENNIIAACGHDQTLDNRILEGFERGLNHVTHIYSMTSGFQRSAGRKHLGTLEMALMTTGVTVEVIADDRHITKHFWDFIRHNKSIEDIVIVSDSMRWAGMPPDPEAIIRLGEIDVVIDDGVAWLADRSAYAGSIATMHSMFRRLVREWGVRIEDAVMMTSWNQACRLGLQRSLGSVEPGKTADFLVLDDDLNLVNVVKSGCLVTAEPVTT